MALSCDSALCLEEGLVRVQRAGSGGCRSGEEMVHFESPNLPPLSESEVAFPAEARRPCGPLTTLAWWET
jgi:hypothetical protein